MGRTNTQNGRLRLQAHKQAKRILELEAIVEQDTSANPEEDDDRKRSI